MKAGLVMHASASNRASISGFCVAMHEEHLHFCKKSQNQPGTQMQIVLHHASQGLVYGQRLCNMLVSGREGLAAW